MYCIIQDTLRILERSLYRVAMAVAPMIADGLRSRLLGGRRPNGVAAAELVPLLGSARGRRRAQPRQRRRGNVDDDLGRDSIEKCCLENSLQF